METGVQNLAGKTGGLVILPVVYSTEHGHAIMGVRYG